MKKGITIGFALVAIVGMLFVGFAAAAAPVSSGTTNSQDKAVYIDSITTAATSSADAADGNRIIVNEISPIGDEHVSILNLGDKALELNGIQLSIKDGSSFTLPAFSLAPSDEVTVFFADGTSSRDVIFTGGNSDNVLNDDAGSVSLFNKDGDSIASTTYTKSQSTIYSLGGTTLTNAAAPASSSAAGITSVSAPTTSSTTTGTR